MNTKLAISYKSQEGLTETNIEAFSEGDLELLGGFVSHIHKTILFIIRKIT